jgi:hypothetical protein
MTGANDIEKRNGYPDILTGVKRIITDIKGDEIHNHILCP